VRALGLRKAAAQGTRRRGLSAADGEGLDSVPSPCRRWVHRDTRKGAARGRRGGLRVAEREGLDSETGRAQRRRRGGRSAAGQEPCGLSRSRAAGLRDADRAPGSCDAASDCGRGALAGPGGVGLGPVWGCVGMCGAPVVP
jgi:hypothetical protein